MQKRNLLALAAITGFFAFSTSKSFLSSITFAAARTLRREGITSATESSPESDLSARIARIENDLQPPAFIGGHSSSGVNIADRMTHYEIPGVSVAFFDHGQIVWTRTYGFADLANRKPVTAETLFEAGSISKPPSALAALRLVQDGKLTLDDNVNSKLRSWAIPENEFTKEQKVTLRLILSHNAGLTGFGFDGYAAGEPVPTMVQILDGEKPANSPPIRVSKVPGTGFRYSDGDYVVLQVLLTDVTGESFPQLLNDLVLKPAEMIHSTYLQPLPDGFESSVATPYRGTGEPVEGGWHTYPEMAAAGLWSTPTDLARLAIEVQNEYAGKSEKILSQDMIHQMLTHQDGDWGLGFAVESPGHKLRFGHYGADEGFRADLEAYTESGQGIAIMTNSDSSDEFIRELRSSVAKEYGWPDFVPKDETFFFILGAIAGTALFLLIVAIWAVSRRAEKMQLGKNMDG